MLILTLNKEEADGLAQLIDAALKAHGVQVLNLAHYFATKLNEASLEALAKEALPGSKPLETPETVKARRTRKA